MFPRLTNDNRVSAPTTVPAVLNTEQFEALYLANRQRIYSMAFQWLRNPSDAEDVTQEVFVRAWTHFASFDSNRPFEFWLMRIARNLCIDFGRRRKLRATLPLNDSSDKEDGPSRTLLEELVDKRGDPAAHMMREQLSEELLRAFETLSPADRTVVLLVEQDFTYLEISLMLNCPLGTIRSRVYRARVRMRQAYAATLQL